MLIRKVSFIHAFKSFTLRRCRGLRANGRRIKYPLSDQEKKKKSINFCDKKVLTAQNEPGGIWI